MSEFQSSRGRDLERDRERNRERERDRERERESHTPRERVGSLIDRRRERKREGEREGGRRGVKDGARNKCCQDEASSENNVINPDQRRDAGMKWINRFNPDNPGFEPVNHGSSSKHAMSSRRLSSIHCTFVASWRTGCVVYMEYI